MVKDKDRRFKGGFQSPNGGVPNLMVMPVDSSVNGSGGGGGSGGG